jgi:hypothetical protein
MASKRRRTPTTIVQMQLRLRENLRRNLEQAAKDHDRSMNAEIVARLAASLLTYHQQTVVMRIIQQAIAEWHDGQQATPRPAAQERPAPPQRPPQTGKA